MRKPVDITGKRFGALTALEIAEKRGGQTYWLCECDCGNTCLAAAGKLRSGQKTSCGCGIHRAAKMVETKSKPEALKKAYGHTRHDSSSGVRGVSYEAAAGRWAAYITHDGKRRFLGRFEEFEDAVSARRQAEQEIISEAKKTRH